MSEKLSFEEMFEQQGYLVYTTKGTSMYPMLRQNRDLVIISAKPEGLLNKYDVILFKRNGKYILHRVVGVKENDYTTAGDNTISKEYHVKDKEILGVLTSFVRDGKEIKTTDKDYKMYVRILYGLDPVRRNLRRTKAKVRSKIKSWIKR